MIEENSKGRRRGLPKWEPASYTDGRYLIRLKFNGEAELRLRGETTIIKMLGSLKEAQAYAALLDEISQKQKLLFQRWLEEDVK